MTQSKKEDPANTLVQPVIEALLDHEHIFPSRFLTFFSDISRQGMDAVREVWSRIAIERKISLLADLETVMEADSLLSFDEIAMFALDDDDPHVRIRAISLLWESNSTRLLDRLCVMLESDPSEQVQAAAACGLGCFVLKGELDEVSETSQSQALSSLREKQATSPSKEIQQEILKSLAYTGSAEVTRQIERANADPDLSWQLAGITAMGRTVDERWEPAILKRINSDVAAMQNEAVKAAGEIELESARLLLLEMLEAGIGDVETRLHVVWALSRIGGDGVRAMLIQLLEETEDEDEMDVIQMALEHLEFTQELPDLDI